MKLLKLLINIRPIGPSLLGESSPQFLGQLEIMFELGKPDNVVLDDVPQGVHLIPLLLLAEI